MDCCLGCGDEIERNLNEDEDQIFNNDGVFCSESCLEQYEHEHEEDWGY